jgi:hypothetical protein
MMICRKAGGSNADITSQVENAHLRDKFATRKGVKGGDSREMTGKSGVKAGPQQGVGERLALQQQRDEVSDIRVPRFYFRAVSVSTQEWLCRLQASG